MNRILPPCCLLLALAMFIAAFTLLAVGRPDASVELHRARVAADDPYRELLELQLLRDRQRRTILIGSLIGLGLLFVLAAFVTMPSRAS